MYKKNADFICPICGIDDCVETMDIEWENDYIVRELTCSACQVDWTEYFSIIYNGYAKDGIDYDVEGEKMYD